MAQAFSALAAAFAVLVAWLVHRGQLYELARNLHRDLTTGEAEEARNVLGGRIRTANPPQDAENMEEAVRAYYRLMWCFERIGAGRERIRRAYLTGLCCPADVRWTTSTASSSGTSGVGDTTSTTCSANSRTH